MEEHKLKQTIAAADKALNALNLWHLAAQAIPSPAQSTTHNLLQIANSERQRLTYSLSKLQEKRKAHVNTLPAQEFKLSQAPVEAAE